ncbi:PLP-dependent aminotransferase family protein [Brevibacillus marinus]|uniref:aminotransferase-like domain-containing protein n=1 Tax=Brevibacillus marinus TaxID=2496837 RepID=UPI000F821FC9|nr:PLP-dependent aminotransferase family protein [Brevibacillus marinus]
MATFRSDWQPDRSSPVPLYKQIIAYLQGKIRSGEWPAGSKIPSQRALAKAMGVNRSTVVTALEELIAEGWLEGKTGSGTVVTGSSWREQVTLPPDWNRYVRAGLYRPNLPTIQEINQAEFLPGIIRLGTGELSPELHPHQLMGEVLSRLHARIRSLGYEEPKGLLFLREQISRYVASLGIQASPGSILVVSGALQALQLISLGILQQGGTILLEKPSYLYSLRLFQSAGIRLAGVPLDAHGIRADCLAAGIKKHRAGLLYTIPSFHNPTGLVMSERRRAEVLRVCEAERLPVVEDDVYRELWLDEPLPAPLKARDRSGLVLYLGSLSKTLSPGLRIGWLIGPEPVIERLADIKMQTDYGASSLAQWAAAEWLASGFYQQHLERIRSGLRRRREILLEALRRDFSDLAEWTVPTGGFYIWLRLHSQVRMRELFDQARAAGLLLHPGNLYDRAATSCLRLSYAYAKETELSEALRLLSRLVRQHAAGQGE